MRLPVPPLAASLLTCALLGCGSPPPPLPPAPQAPPPPAAEASAEARGASGHESEKGPLILRGVPPIPEELDARMGQYLNTRTATLGELSDDGKTMLVATRFAETNQLHRVEAPGGARYQLTFNDEPVRQPSFVPGTTDQILYMSDIGGNEAYQLFRLDLRSGKTTLLTDGKSRHGGYRWSDDGKHVAYTSNARNGKDMDLYVGDGRSKAAGKLLLERKGHWYPIDWTRDAKRLLVGEYISINDSRLYVVDVDTKAVTRLSPEQPTAAHRNAVLDPAGRKIYFTSDRGGEFNQLYEQSLGAAGSQPAEPKLITGNLKWNVESVALSPDGRTLAFVTNEHGYGNLHVLDTATGNHRPTKGLPRGLVRNLRYARKAPVLGFTLMGPTENGDAFTYDVKTQRLTRWTESELGGLDKKTFVEPELVEYPSFDELEIPAFYYRPKSAGPHPVVVWIHGGPESQARPYFSSLIQYLVVESQIAVLVPNVRGSDGYGKSYLLLDNGMKREDSVKDIGALLDWVGTRPELDQKRMAVLGGSYGGYMVLASLMHFADRLVAGVDIVGISNFVTFLENTKEYRRDLRRAEYGDERKPEMREFLTRISPSTNASKIRSALFLAHGANDPRVPLSETDQMVAEIQKNGGDVWTMVAMNEGHGFRKKENRDMFARLSALFLEKHLKP